MKSQKVDKNQDNELGSMEVPFPALLSLEIAGPPIWRRLEVSSVDIPNQKLHTTTINRGLRPCWEITKLLLLLLMMMDDDNKKIGNALDSMFHTVNTLLLVY